MAKGLKEAKFGVASPPWFYIAGSSFTVVQKTFEFETWTARSRNPCTSSWVSTTYQTLPSPEVFIHRNASHVLLLLLFRLATVPLPSRPAPKEWALLDYKQWKILRRRKWRGSCKSICYTETSIPARKEGIYEEGRRGTPSCS